jgi:hypothetical protein
MPRSMSAQVAFGMLVLVTSPASADRHDPAASPLGAAHPVHESTRGGGTLPRAAAPRCTEASIADVALPAPLAIDEIRVLTAGDSPEGGATMVTVDTDRSERTLRVEDQVSKRLSFHSPLVASSFHVSLLPDLGARATACVERVELLSGGVPVAVVTP